MDNGYFVNGKLSTLPSLNWFLLNVLTGNHLGTFALFANALIHPSVIRQLHHHLNWTQIFIKLEMRLKRNLFSARWCDLKVYYTRSVHTELNRKELKVVKNLWTF